MSAYYARVCWNENGWRFPSGATGYEAGYAGQNRFGHEEWLFNFAWLVDGYHYSFLQPGNKALRKRQGEALDLLLWSIRPDGVRVTVGRITTCKVLTANEAQYALQYRKRIGWFKQMEEDVVRVDGDTRELDYTGLFNVRFRREDATVYNPPVPFEQVPKKIVKGRYQLMEATGIKVKPTMESWRSKGMTALPPPPPDHLARAGSKAGIVDPQHARLQKRLMQLLQGHFGKENVTREGGWRSAQVDLVVKDGQRRLLIEIKPYANAREALREAIGQILEYAYFYSSESSDGESIEDIELFIVAPALADEITSKYLNLLQTRFQMPIHYYSFSLADPIPAALIRMGQGRDKPANTQAIRNPRRVPSEARHRSRQLDDILMCHVHRLRTRNGACTHLYVFRIRPHRQTQDIPNNDQRSDFPSLE